MHCAIVEDLDSDRQYLMDLIRKNCSKNHEHVDFSCFNCGEFFLQGLHHGLYSVVFLDILLGENGISGIETALKMREFENRLPIIFTTTDPGFALEGYKAHPLDYLLKPIQEADLDWCLTELREHMAAPVFILVQENTGQGTFTPRTILLDQFLYAETVRHGLILHTLEGEIFTRMTFSQLAELFPRNGRFHVSGRGQLLNFSHVKTIYNDGRVLLKNGQSIFSTRRKAKDTQAAFSSYIFASLRQGNKGGIE